MLEANPSLIVQAPGIPTLDADASALLPKVKRWLPFK
jgi:hypothetical protein